MKKKKCINCKKEKPISDFYINGKYLNSQCKFCKNEIRKEYYKNNIKESRKKYKFNYANREIFLLTSYNHIDKTKGRCCDLTVEWIKENITGKPCIYCGRMVPVGCDRKDNSKGHTKDNVVPCCKTCNWTRSNLYSFEEMKLIGKVLETTIYPMRKQVPKCDNSCNENDI